MTDTNPWRSTGAERTDWRYQPPAVASRRRAVAALNLAFEELLGQRAAASGRDRELALLMSLIRQARLAAEAAAGLDYLGERPPPQAAAHADALASAVLGGKAVPTIEAPPAPSRAMLALYHALNQAATTSPAGQRPVRGRSAAPTGRWNPPGARCKARPAP